jgi:hypothetical protein
MDALAGVHARAAGAFASTGGHEQDGCAKIGVWLRRELRLSGAEVRQRRRAAEALAQLDQVRAAADAAQIRPEHVTVFGHGIAKVGAQTMREAEQLLVPVAKQCDPSVLRTAIDHLHQAVDPDGPDRDWAQAQEKQDLTCTRAGHGWNVRGFLDPEIGAKLHQVLNSWARPTPDADGADGAEPDHRPVARRRVEGLHTLLTDYLGSGLPTDKGIRPHLNVTVDADTLRLALAGDRTTPTATPATLAGYGVIGRDLLARLACDTALSVLLTDTTTDRHRCTGHHTDASGQDDGLTAGDGPRPLHRCGCPLTPYVHVLDVGRTERIATPQQRLAVLTAQHHRCATPGCTNQHLEIHHIVSWLHGGPTDMNNLIGLCTSCHTLLHRGLISCHPDGHGGATFTRNDGTPIPDIQRHAMATYAEHLDDHISATILKQARGRHRPRSHPPDDDPEPRAA